MGLKDLNRLLAADRENTDSDEETHDSPPSATGETVMTGKQDDLIKELEQQIDALTGKITQKSRERQAADPESAEPAEEVELRAAEEEIEEDREEVAIVELPHNLTVSEAESVLFEGSSPDEVVQLPHLDSFRELQDRIAKLQRQQLQLTELMTRLSETVANNRHRGDTGDLGEQVAALQEAVDALEDRDTDQPQAGQDMEMLQEMQDRVDDLAATTVTESDLSEIQSDMNELRETVSALQDREDEDVDISRLRADIEELRDMVQTPAPETGLQEAVNELRDRFNDLSADEGVTEAELESLKQEVSTLRSSLDAADAPEQADSRPPSGDAADSVAAVEQRLQDLSADEGVTEGELAELMEEVDNLHQTVDRLAASGGGGGESAAVEELQEKVAALEELQEKIQSMTQKQGTAIDEMLKLDRKVEKLEQQAKDGGDQDLDAMQEKIDDLEDGLADAATTDDLEALRDQLKSMFTVLDRVSTYLEENE